MFTVHSSLKLNTVNRKLSAKNQFGFTLIELLVAITVAGILIGITIPSLVSFNRRQQLKNARTEIESALRFTQNKALAAEIDDTLCTATYPGGNKLLGWFANFPATGNVYYISGRCAPATDFGRRDFKLPEGINFTSNEIYILFGPTTSGIAYYNNLANLGIEAARLPINSFTISLVNTAAETGSVTVTDRGEIR